MEELSRSRSSCSASPSPSLRYLSWDDYFLAIAFLSAQRSKDPNRQVGACLVSQNGVILEIKVRRSFGDKVSKLYLTMFPCNECAKVIIQVRQSWDAYIRPGGSRIPGHWVQSPPPADEIWASYLVPPIP
ncbi:hypothetical protein Drorol1_Dr00024274, partial [Drosera rotundifolia]